MEPSRKYGAVIICTSCWFWPSQMMSGITQTMFKVCNLSLVQFTIIIIISNPLFPISYYYYQDKAKQCAWAKINLLTRHLSYSQQYYIPPHLICKVHSLTSEEKCHYVDKAKIFLLKFQSCKFTFVINQHIKVSHLEFQQYYHVDWF